MLGGTFIVVEGKCKLSFERVYKLLHLIISLIYNKMETDDVTEPLNYFVFLNLQ